MRRAYQLIHGEQYSTHFLEFLEFYESYPALKPEIFNPIKIGNTLAFLGSINFLDKDIEKETIKVGTKFFIYEYNLTNKNVSKCIHIPVEEIGNIHISCHEFIIQNDMYYFLIHTSKISEAPQIVVKYQRIDDRLVFQESIKFTQPETYIKNGFAGNFRNIKYRDGLFTFNFSEKIFDINTGQEYHIPISDKNFESLDGLLDYTTGQLYGAETSKERIFYGILDIAKKNDYIGVIYRNYEGLLIEVVFDPQSNQVIRSNQFKLSLNEVKSLKYYAHDHNKVVYLFRDEDCFKISPIKEVSFSI